tara:strand:+ start:286 stop:1101 length:816 start_codon:yes stop_codon:yes gene_type:complete
MEGQPPPEILPVKSLPNTDDRPLHPNLPKPPALLLMISPVKTGKSTIISNLLLNSNFFGQDYFDETIVFSPTIHNDATSRFLKKHASCYDTYSDDILQSIIDDQSSYEDKTMRPSIALILDDIIGVFKGKGGREPMINSLASRFRHYGIDLLLMSSQNYRRVNPVVRSNCTHLIIGSPFPNVKELHKIFEEMGDSFSGSKNLEAIYRRATPNKYDFLYLDLTENPPIAYRNFTEKIAVGGGGYSDVVAKGNFNMGETKPLEEKPIEEKKKQ